MKCWTEVTAINSLFDWLFAQQGELGYISLPGNDIAVTSYWEDFHVSVYQLHPNADSCEQNERGNGCLEIFPLQVVGVFYYKSRY